MLTDHQFDGGRLIAFFDESDGNPGAGLLPTSGFLGDHCGDLAGLLVGGIDDVVILLQERQCLIVGLVVSHRHHKGLGRTRWWYLLGRFGLAFFQLVVEIARKTGRGSGNCQDCGNTKDEFGGLHNRDRL